MPSLVNEWFYLSSARFLLVKTVQYSSQRRGTPNLHLLSHPLTLRRCNLSNESNCIVCRDAPLEFLNLPWCPSPVTGIAVVPSLTQTFPRQELQCPMTNEIRPLLYACDIRLIFELAMVQEWSPLSILSISMHVQCYNYSIVFGNGMIPHRIIFYE